MIELRRDKQIDIILLDKKSKGIYKSKVGFNLFILFSYNNILENFHSDVIADFLDPDRLHDERIFNSEHLDVHTEMFADSLLPLIEKVVVSRGKKKIDHGKLGASILMRLQNLYDFVDNNPMGAIMAVTPTNKTDVINENTKVSATNSALTIDITGSVCTHFIRLRHYSGIDGQINFICGADRSKRKKTSIAHPSVTRKELSNISATLIEKSAVISTRANMHWVVTKQEAINFYSKTLEEPAQLLISCAHTEHQETLDQAADERIDSNYRFIQSNKKKYEAGIFLPFYILKTVGNLVFWCSKMKNYEFNLN